MRSKAFRGYDAAFMEACRQELALTADGLANTEVAVADLGGQAVGLVQVAVADDVAVLAKLFVSPDAMGSGAGRSPFAWARSASASR